MFDYQKGTGLEGDLPDFFFDGSFSVWFFWSRRASFVGSATFGVAGCLAESSMFLPKNPQFFVPAQPIPTRTNQNMHRKLHGLSHGHMPGWLRNRRETPHPLKHVVYYQLGSSFHFTGSENQSNPKNKSHHVYVICTVYRYGRCSAFRQD
jgi:hypothetical protein